MVATHPGTMLTSIPPDIPKWYLVDAPASSTGQQLTQEQLRTFPCRIARATSLLDGWMDETRISTVGRTQAWARLSCENQRTDRSLSQNLEYLSALLLRSQPDRGQWNRHKFPDIEQPTGNLLRTE